MSRHVTTAARAAALVAFPAAAIWAPLASPAAADDPEMVEHCWTVGLTDEEVAEGMVSEITCEWVEEGEPFGGFASRDSYFVLGQIWDGANGAGRYLPIVGPDCDRNAVLPIDDWGDEASSTANFSCGNMKHYLDAAFSSSQMYNVSPNSWTIYDLTGVFNNNVQSILFS